MKTVGSSITAVGIAALLSALAMPQKTSAQYVTASGGDEVYIVVTNGAGYRVHKFTTPGDFDVTAAGEVRFLMVGGGGGVSVDGAELAADTNRPGGGGGGGFLLNTDGTNLTVQTYTITVGAASYTDGNASLAFGESAPGGGQGGYFDGENLVVGGTGASGGGGGGQTNTPASLPGSGTLDWGYAGGTALVFEDNELNAGGGGGGAGGLGSNAYHVVDGSETNVYGGHGGPGMSSDIDGVMRWYGGGGGGAGVLGGGASGQGGGGAGFAGTDALGAGTAGAANTGGGGGGGRRALGGSGIVVIRYALDPAKPVVNEESATFTNIETGSERFTGANKVKVSHLPDPVEFGHVYDRYQVTESDDPDSLTVDWKTEAEIKALELEFVTPGSDSLVTLYLWYTNSSDSVLLQRAQGEIIYTTVAPDPVVVPSVERDTDGFTVRLTYPELDAGSTPGTALDEAMAWHQRFAQLKSGPSINHTPEEAYVTLLDPGEYTLELVLINEAGNVATGEVAVTLSAGELPEDGDYHVAIGNLNAEAPYDTWPKAAATIQDAVDRLNTDENDGAVIRVAAGIYAGTGANVVALTRPLSLLGASGNRDNVIIDGESARRGINMNLTTEGAEVLIAALTVTNGYSWDRNAGGGGIRVQHSTIETGKAEIRDCVIAGNTSHHGHGGGVYTVGKLNTGFHTLLSKCLIKGNELRQPADPGNIYNLSYGGGISARRTRLTVDNTTVSHNRDFGGPHWSNFSAGGGLSLFELSANSVIRDTIIEENRASQAQGNVDYGGQGLHFQSSAGHAVLIERSIIRNNFRGSHAGGLQNFGAFVILRNCLIHGHSSAYGSAIFLARDANSIVILESSTIIHNEWGGTGGQAIRLGASGTHLAVTNSIVYHNDSNYGRASGATWEWSNSCTTPSPGGEGIITTDPWMGEDPVALEYRLPEDSPVIDQGTNLFWMADGFDLAGRKRLDVVVGIVDMGAYEWHPVIRGTMILIK